MSSNGGWIGVDFDGTLAHYESWSTKLGEPIPKMVKRVKRWLAEGKTVKIFTARVYHPPVPALGTTAYSLVMKRKNEADTARKNIQAWCKKHIGEELEVTNVKDYAMVELWDDRAVGVKSNTGERVG